MGENMNIPDEYLPRVGAGREELITFYSWEFEDAKKAQNEWDKADHQPSGRGPFFRWVAAIELIELAEQFKETEDKRVLLQAISICALNDFAIPQWCASSYIKSFRDAWHYRVKSWDEAFGPLNPHTLKWKLGGKNGRCHLKYISVLQKSKTTIHAYLLTAHCLKE